MNKIEKDELFRNLSDFLKTKGIELQEGTYTQRIQQGCGLLAETVNMSQQAFERAKAEMERQLDQMRQVIHEKTAPKSASAQAKTEPPRAEAKSATNHGGPKKPKQAKTAARRSKRGR